MIYSNAMILFVKKSINFMIEEFLDSKEYKFLYIFIIIVVLLNFLEVVQMV